MEPAVVEIAAEKPIAAKSKATTINPPIAVNGTIKHPILLGSSKKSSIVLFVLCNDLVVNSYACSRPQPFDSEDLGNITIVQRSFFKLSTNRCTLVIAAPRCP